MWTTDTFFTFKNRYKITVQLSYFNMRKWVFWRNKHDNPKFLLHLMIADMLGFVPLKFNTIVNVDNYVMRGGLRKQSC